MKLYKLEYSLIGGHCSTCAKSGLVRLAKTWRNQYKRCSVVFNPTFQTTTSSRKALFSAAQKQFKRLDRLIIASVQHSTGDPKRIRRLKLKYPSTPKCLSLVHIREMIHIHSFSSKEVN